MNKVVLMGRLTADPKVTVSQTSNGESMTIARYTLAVDRRGKDAGADFISCVTFGKGGEFAEKYLTKGTKICIEGRIQTGSYKNKDGNTIYTTDVVVENHEFAGAKAESSESAAKPTQSNDGFMDIPEDDPEGLPFN